MEFHSLKMILVPNTYNYEEQNLATVAVERAMITRIASNDSPVKNYEVASFKEVKLKLL